MSDRSRNRPQKQASVLPIFVVGTEMFNSSLMRRDKRSVDLQLKHVPCVEVVERQTQWR